VMSSKVIAVLAVSFVASWLATKALIPLLRRRGMLDVPNSRSSHDIPTPRGGGVGIVFGLVVGAVTAGLAGMPLPGLELLAGALVMALIGFIDDRWGGLSAFARLALHLAVAAFVVYRTGGLVRLPLPEPLDVPLGLLAVPAALIWIVGVTNLYNFLDGIDGFAGLQGVVVGLAVAFLDEGGLFTVVGLTVAGACTGFLLHNWHPAKVFMGDVGSGTLGFLLAALPFQLEPAARSKAVFLITICLWFFLSDGVFTICRRLLRGEKIWDAHCSHLYQRLVKTGLRHDEVVLKVIGAAAVLAVLAVASARVGEPSAWWGVFAAALGSFLAYCWWTWSREDFSRGPRRAADTPERLTRSKRMVRTWPSFERSDD
jgi:UDP-N-acetylmuramyl pentapeptide phosphotransferase/UDP-N-acetylglucosamine-1-phosphate transferase